MSKNALGRAVTKLAAERGHPQVRPDGSRVRRWIDKGERPRNPVPELLAQVLSERTGYCLSAADLGLSSTPPRDDTCYRGPAEILDDIQRTTSGTMARGPGTMRASYASIPRVGQPRRLLASLESWSWSSPRPLPSAARHGRLGRADAERIAAHTAALRQMDNRHGGASMCYMAAAHLATTNSLITGGTYTEATGRALFRELGDLCGVVGWASHDSADYASAIRYLTMAVHAARESGDRSLTAHLLQCLARILGYVGYPQAARDCIALALYGSRNTASPRLRAGLHALDARFAALLAAPRDALRAIHLSREIFAEDDTDEIPAFVSYIDEAELSSILGEVLLFLSRKTDTSQYAGDAIGMLTVAIANRAEHRVRSRTFDAIALARAQLFTGQSEAACTAAAQAMTISAGLVSARVRRRFHDLGREARAHPDIPHAREIHDRLTPQPCGGSASDREATSHDDEIPDPRPVPRPNCCTVADLF
jgi:hypothetical protein